LFVDLKKAYDSVPRDALWIILEKCGMPPRMFGPFIKEVWVGVSDRKKWQGVQCPPPLFLTSILIL